MTARLFRYGLVALALLLTAGATVMLQSAPAPLAEQLAAGDSRYVPEVRLRKLHLVRPDLLPYPISFEIYC